MYKDYKKYPNLKKLPNDINQAIKMLTKKQTSCLKLLEKMLLKVM